MEFSKRTLRSVFFGASGCILLYWLLHETAKVNAFFSGIWGLLAPFVIGAAFAFVLNVPMRGIEKALGRVKKKGVRRVLAITLTVLIILLALAGVVYILVPQISETVSRLAEAVPGFFARIEEKILRLAQEHPRIAQWISENTDLESLDWATIAGKVADTLSQAAGMLLSTLLNTVKDISAGIVNAVISFAFCLYCLGRKEILARQFRRVIYAFLPEKICDEIIRIMRMTNITFSNFISGQCLEAVILACLFAVSMSIFRMPYVALVSVTIMVTALVPIVGAFVGCVVGAFFIMVDSVPMALGFVLLFLTLQQLEDNFIYPKVVGTSIGLPGMWVLFAVTVGGGLMGVGGMLIMIPLASVVYALAREIVERRLAARGIDNAKLQAVPIARETRLGKTLRKRAERKTNSKKK